MPEVTSQEYYVVETLPRHFFDQEIEERDPIDYIEKRFRDGTAYTAEACTFPTNKDADLMNGCCHCYLWVRLLSPGPAEESAAGRPRLSTALSELNGRS